MSTFNFNAMPIRFLIACALIAAIELVISRVHPQIATVQQVHREEKLAHSAQATNDYEVLLLGDSSIAWGVQPSVLESETGLSIYNFALYGRDSIFMPRCVLKHYLETAAKKPKLLVLGFMHPTFTLEEIYKDSIYEFDRRCTGEFVLDHGPVDWLFSLMPSFRHSLYLRNVMHYRTFAWRSAADDKQLRVDLKQKRGYYNPRPDDRWDRRAEPRALRRYPDFGLGEFSTRYFEEILQLASKHNISVLYIIPPTPDGPIAEYNAFIRSVAETHPGVAAFDPQQEFYNDQLFYDGWHLNADGARKLSVVVAAKLKHLLR